MRIVNGLIYDPEAGFLPGEIETSGEKIRENKVSENGEKPGQEAVSEFVLDASGCYVIPGLIDLHFHGCVGEDFSDADPEGLHKMAEYELSEGIPYICPAGMTLPETQLLKICRNAAAYRKEKKSGAELVGINLEGPFLCREKRGAQNAAFLHEPDIAMLHRLEQAADGLVSLLTVAPENPGALYLIKDASQRMIVSVGHTMADYSTAQAAFQNGARQVTHLYNAMPPLNHRKPGVIGAAFDCPDVRAELISDGMHVHPAVIRMTFRMLGRERVILISDSLRATGMPDGEYPFGGQEIIVSGGCAVLKHDRNTLAGSVTNLMGCVRRAVQFGIPLADAVRAASTNPAQALGLYDRIGSLENGKDATMVLLDQKDLSVRHIVFKGKLVR